MLVLLEHVLVQQAVVSILLKWWSSIVAVLLDSASSIFIFFLRRDRDGLIDCNLEWLHVRQCELPLCIHMGKLKRGLKRWFLIFISLLIYSICPYCSAGLEENRGLVAIVGLNYFVNVKPENSSFLWSQWAWERLHLKLTGMVDMYVWEAGVEFFCAQGVGC